MFWPADRLSDSVEDPYSAKLVSGGYLIVQFTKQSVMLSLQSLKPCALHSVKLFSDACSSFPVQFTKLPPEPLLFLFLTQPAHSSQTGSGTRKCSSGTTFAHWGVFNRMYPVVPVCGEEIHSLGVLGGGVRVSSSCLPPWVAVFTQKIEMCLCLLHLSWVWSPWRSPREWSYTSTHS